MQAFAALCRQLDELRAEVDGHDPAPPALVAPIAVYLREAPHVDAVWAVHLLDGGRAGRGLAATFIRSAACQAADLEDWLFAHCQAQVGELAETVALVLPDPPPVEPGEAASRPAGLAGWIDHQVRTLRDQAASDRSDALAAAWRQLDRDGRWLHTRLVLGLRLKPLPGRVLARALAAALGVEEAFAAAWLADRAGPGEPHPDQPASLAEWQRLASPSGSAQPEAGLDNPGPSPRRWWPPDGPAKDKIAALEHRLGPLESLRVTEWLGGLPVTLIRTPAGCQWWHDGERLVPDDPSLAAAAADLPVGCRLEGELITGDDGGPRIPTHEALMQRCRRHRVSRTRASIPPLVFVVHAGGEAVPSSGLPGLAAPDSPARPVALQAARAVDVRDAAALLAHHGQARGRGCAGLRLARREDDAQAPDALLWPVETLQVDAVLLYARQAGPGRRARWSDYTFGVWSRRPASADEAETVAAAIAAGEPPGPLQLLGVAQVADGLDEAQRRQLDDQMRETAAQRFGPVHTVRPGLVATLAYDRAVARPRSRSGRALEGVRVLALHPLRPIHLADTLADLDATPAPWPEPLGPIGPNR